MNRVLILGAGMVSKPLVRYLLERKDYRLTVASRTVSKAEALIDKHPNGSALELDVRDEGKLEQLVAENDIVVSLLPYTLHVKVAHLCIEYGRDMVTTSYVGLTMRGLDERARKAGIILLNECGLDPGIDHMSAMRIIHDVKGRGGRIVSFSSCCGALPAHISNTNPMGYKFSWAPRGVIMAGKNPAKLLRNGKVVDIPGPELFNNYELKTIPGVGVFENYPNRNSLPYGEIYGIQDAREIYRGTLRYTGWCETLKKLVDIGYMDETERDDIEGRTYRQILMRLIKGEDPDVSGSLVKSLGLDPADAVLKRLEWLGLMSDESIPEEDNTYLDVLVSRMLRMMPMLEGDIDMCVLFHEFHADFSDGHKEYITSTLVNYGIPQGDTAIARTVALPAAIAVRMVAEGKITEKGVRVPVDPNIYEPILQELDSMGIKCMERYEII